MILNNVRLVSSNEVINIEITGTLISNIVKVDSVNHRDTSEQIFFDNAMAFPGLINSHDHLDFNLFPQLGNNLYNNYREWANYLHEHYKDEIKDVLQVPEHVRAKWGVYKNLLCGVTTVVNHGKKLSLKNLPITVYQQSESLHSVAFEKNWKRKLNNLFKKHKLVAIHTGEGIDEFAYNEIEQLIKWNIAKRKLIGIHGVAMVPEQARHFNGLVWCPASNYFLFNKTADIRALKSHVPICFGSDSTLTSQWNIWEQLRLAKRITHVGDEELLEMVTTNPASIFKLNCGKIEAGKDADVVIANEGVGSVFSVNPADILLVVHKGNISLADKSVVEQIGGYTFKDYSIVELGASIKYVKGDLNEVIAEVRKLYRAASIPCKPISMSPVYN
jgi:cytosine/adenosine deaminase-related metal-dependent hydrolase